MALIDQSSFNSNFSIPNDALQRDAQSIIYLTISANPPSQTYTCASAALQKHPPIGVDARTGTLRQTIFPFHDPGDPLDLGRTRFNARALPGPLSNCKSTCITFATRRAEAPFHSESRGLSFDLAHWGSSGGCVYRYTEDSETL